MKNAPGSAQGPVTKLAFRHRARDNSVQAAASDLRAVLQRWVRAPTTPQRVALRSRIVLLALDGLREDEIAARLHVSRPTVKLWMRRFARHGPEGLVHDAPGRGRHPSMSPSTMWNRLRQAKLLGPDGLPVSIRRAAAFLGVSASSVWRASKKVHVTAHPQSRKPPSVT
jgi:transposase-like protein